MYSLLRIGGRATAQGFEGLVITLFDKNVNLEPLPLFTNSLHKHLAAGVFTIIRERRGKTWIGPFQCVCLTCAQLPANDGCYREEGGAGKAIGGT